MKFRVWDKNTKEFYYSPDLNDHDAAKRWFVFKEDMDCEAGLAPLQQIIGLKNNCGHCGGGISPSTVEIIGNIYKNNY